MIDIDLAGRVALVTGGSRGIGRAAVLRFAAAGADVCSAYHSRHAEAKAAAHDVPLRDMAESQWRPVLAANLIQLRRVTTADDVAGPILFLCSDLGSDLARHITGEVLNVNGGSVLCG